MLMLTRKVGERILIGENIFVVVTKIKDNQAVLGIDAPPNVEVDREEIRLRKRSEPRA